MIVTRTSFVELLVATTIVAATAVPSLAWADPDSATGDRSSLLEEATALEKELAAMRQDLSVAVDEYDTCIQRHQDALDKLEQNQKRLDSLNSRIKNLQKRLGIRVRAMYKNDSGSLLDAILGMQSFEDLSASWEMLNIINTEDANLAAEIKIARKNLQAVREDYSAQEKVAADSLAKADEFKKQAEEKVASYEARLVSINAELYSYLETSEAEREAAWAAAYAGGAEDPVHSDVIEYAISRLGTPYIWGAKGPDSFDCSGLTSWCYAQAGIYIPGSSATQYEYAASNAEVLAVSEARPGDVLYIGYGGAGTAGHVGIYIGAGQFIHAPSPGDYVKISSNMGLWTFALRF